MDTEVRLSEPAGRWVLSAAVLGSALAMLDATVVNVALPTIGEDLDATLGGLQWTVNGYALTLSAFLLLGGSLGDRLGRRRVFLIGIGWFAVASLLCAVAPNIESLALARVLQGVGGALLTPGSLAMISASFHPDDRARAIGAWSGLGALAAAAGPFVGGWLVEGPGWRWIFAINVPLAALVVVVSLRHVPETRDATAHGRFDLAGAATGALALAGITYAFIDAADRGIANPRVALSAVAGVVLLVAFVLTQRRGANPMVPSGIFASRQFTAVNVVTFAVYAALSGVTFFVVLELQLVTGYSPLAAGTAFLPITVLLFALSSWAGGLAQRIGPRLPMTLGPALAALGVLLMARIGAGSSYLVDVLPAVLLFGLGLALTVAPLTATVLAAADDRHAGIASGINNAVARAAGLLAVAAMPLAVGLGGDDYRNPVKFSEGYELATVVCAALLAIGAMLSWAFVRNDVLDAEDVSSARMA